MKRNLIFAVCFCTLAALLANIGIAADDKKEEKKARSNKEIMKIAHQGPKSVLTSLAKDLEAEPMWDVIGKKTKELTELAAEMASNKAKKGGPDSWKKLTAEYAADAKLADEAAAKKDADAAKKAVSTLRDTCKGCHSVHR